MDTLYDQLATIFYEIDDFCKELHAAPAMNRSNPTPVRLPALVYIDSTGLTRVPPQTSDSTPHLSHLCTVRTHRGELVFFGFKLHLVINDRGDLLTIDKI
jgi:hypothetical protein